MNGEDRYFDLQGLADYSGLSIATLRRYMRDSEHPLPHHQLRAAGKAAGRVLVRKSEFDAWVESFRATRVARTAPVDATLAERVERALVRSRR